MNFANRNQAAAGVTLTAEEYLRLECLSAIAEGISGAGVAGVPQTPVGSVAAWERATEAALAEYFAISPGDEGLASPDLVRYVRAMGPRAFARLAAQVHWQWTTARN